MYPSEKWQSLFLITCYWIWTNSSRKVCQISTIKSGDIIREQTVHNVLCIIFSSTTEILIVVLVYFHFNDKQKELLTHKSAKAKGWSKALFVLALNYSLLTLIFRLDLTSQILFLGYIMSKWESVQKDMTESVDKVQRESICQACNDAASSIPGTLSMIHGTIISDNPIPPTRISTAMKSAKRNKRRK